MWIPNFSLLYAMHARNAINQATTNVTAELKCKIDLFNPLVTNGLSHHYPLGESTVIR